MGRTARLARRPARLARKSCSPAPPGRGDALGGCRRSRSPTRGQSVSPHPPVSKVRSTFLVRSRSRARRAAAGLGSTSSLAPYTGRPRWLARAGRRGVSSVAKGPSPPWRGTAARSAAPERPRALPAGRERPAVDRGVLLRQPRRGESNRPVADPLPLDLGARRGTPYAPWPASPRGAHAAGGQVPSSQGGAGDRAADWWPTPTPLFTALWPAACGSLNRGQLRRLASSTSRRTRRRASATSAAPPVAGRIAPSATGRAMLFQTRRPDGSNRRRASR